MQKEMKLFKEAFDERLKAAISEEVKIVIKEQYADAFGVLTDWENATLIPGIIGPPGRGKTLL
ncbi:MAG: hypothetical protein ACW99H_08235, partial [Candidatus Thorarchaeota archaeon]